MKLSEGVLLLLIEQIENPPKLPPYLIRGGYIPMPNETVLLLAREILAARRHLADFKRIKESSLMNADCEVRLKAYDAICDAVTKGGL